MRRAGIVAALLIVTVSGVLLSQTSTQNPHGTLKWDCQDCHTSASWSELKQPMNFNHDETGFKLSGAHASADCIGCHKDLVFSHVGTSCVDCHSDHHQGKVGLACQNCHNTNDWHNQTDQLQLHVQKGFPLIGVHAVADCEACHTGATNQVYTNTPVECIGCHQEDFTKTTSPSHVDRGFSYDCRECHSSNGWTPSTFDHSKVGTNCYGCHQPDYLSAKDPDHVAGSYDHNCALCHSTLAWIPATFDHNTSAFPLTGAHANVACASCHTTGFKNTPTDCYACHQTAFTTAANPNHVTNNISHTCVTCHSTAGWSPSTFNHATTSFPLTGAHQTANCVACHTNGYSGGTPTDCWSCHSADFTSASPLNHVSNNISHTCTTCHTTTAWNPPSFNHATTTFPLTGAHTTVACGQCHTNGYSGNTPTDCWSCHQTQYNGTTDPNHAAQNFSHDCTQCHNTSSWGSGNFNHSATTFPLTGAHTTVACASCHTTGYNGGTPTDCYACHTMDFTGAKSPDHVASGVSHTCTTCHSTSVWQPSTFDHSTTSFPLTGLHTSATCIACHTTTGFSGGTPTDCYACHQADFVGATPLNHVSNNISHTCATCHSTAGWTPPTFNHATTAFPLTGFHTTVNCGSCHTNGYNGGTPTDCYSCHATDFASASPLNHVSNNISHTCTTCHNTTAWTPPSFNHATTSFPLTGFHTTVNCVSCHTNGYNGGTPTDCYSCHATDFASASPLNHVSNNISHTCTTCHTTTAWTPPSFNHATTSFPLTGAHTSVSCVACHTSGYNGGTPTDCYACHSADYAGTNNPVHTAANFPTTCITCHTTSNWTSSTWNHDTQYFPIYSGTHAGRWTTCADCHVNAANYATFECIDCHTHSQTTTDQQHAQVGGYQYLSTACYSCHPRGSGG